MESTNKGRRANCDLIKAARNSELCDDWPLAFGRSSIDDNSWGICTNSLRASEIPEELSDPKEMAELVAHLLNLHYRGMLFFGNPDQLKLFD